MKKLKLDEDEIKNQFDNELQMQLVDFSEQCDDVQWFDNQWLISQTDEDEECHEFQRLFF